MFPVPQPPSHEPRRVQNSFLNPHQLASPPPHTHTHTHTHKHTHTHTQTHTHTHTHTNKHTYSLPESPQSRNCSYAAAQGI